MPFLDTLNAARARAQSVALTAFVTVSAGCQKLEPLLAIGSKVYYYGFIPLVILLGMNSSPRPRLTDLLSPM